MPSTTAQRELMLILYDRTWVFTKQDWQMILYGGAAGGGKTQLMKHKVNQWLKATEWLETRLIANTHREN
jgi:hypothetical protein